MKHALFAGTMAICALVLVVNADSQGGDKKEKEKEITIKMVMKAHAKGGLLDKVKKGDASAEDKKKLLELYEGLAKTMPPMGDAEGWKAKTEALVKAVKDDDTKALAKAANCAACHKVYKGK